jgi:hypothetical protein
VKKNSEDLVKCVDFSYPSSDNAKRFNFPDGCYSVSLHSNTGSKALAGFKTEDEAQEYADNLPNKWASWSPNARMQPQEVAQ